MKTDALTIHTTIEPSDEVVDMATRLAIPKGWGVFEDRSGRVEKTASNLRDVRLTCEEAEIEAVRLNEIEGVVEFDTAADGSPKAALRLQVNFSVSRVELTDTQAEIVLYSTYRKLRRLSSIES